jgi:micrococcal nuclease
MTTLKKVIFSLCGSVVLATTLFNSLRVAGLSRQVQSFEDSQRVVEEAVHSSTTRSAARQAPADGSEHKVLRVVDGDTVEIETETGPLKVRVIGIDTPETVHPTKPVEPGGPEATARAKELLEGQTVIIQYDPDPKHDRWDIYRRLLAYLELPDGRDFGLVMVEEGYAAVYTKYPFSRQDSYLEAAQQSLSLN